MKKFRKILKDGALEPTPSVDGKLTQENAKPERKGKKRRRLAFKIMFVMSIVSVMISVTYSWFSASDTAVISDVSIEVADRLVIEIDDLDKHGQLDTVTGDGRYFFKPTTIESSVIGSKNIIGDGETAKSEYSVTVYDKAGDEFKKLFDVSDPNLLSTSVNGVRIIDFTLSKPGAVEEIFLQEGTKIEAYKAPTQTDGAEGEENANAEVFADAPDYLPGALRVAILKQNQATKLYDLQLIWIPDVTSTVNGEDEIEDSFSYLSGEDGSVEKEFSFSGAESGDKTEDGVRYVWGDITDDSSISLGMLSSTKTRFRVVIWLDGNDRETNPELIGQKFEAIFKIAPNS